ncbi:HAD family hydrolase [Burkholderia mayonis]|uniref:HAD family hydrolase n=1 Tax=Burkholderia mayonis TaxID=1385591 RepID=UPI000A89EB80|nr:HAD family hydrolase [Burkholderia mayonis]
MPTLLLLDLDGTLVDTPHYEAWRSAARRIGAEELTYPEYVTHIAGHPRVDGAARLLLLKKGRARANPRAEADSGALAKIKQREFLRLAAHTRLFDDALRLLERIEAAKQRVLFYTASRNAPGLFDAALRRAGKLFDPHAIVQQRRDQTKEALFLRLIGKHAPDSVTLVDDAPHAVDAACGLGIRACQIRRHAFEPAAADPRVTILPTLDALAVPINGFART